MKKWSLWLFASFFVAAFTLTACGDDDDEDTTPPVTPVEEPTMETSVVGYWKGFIAASNPDDLAMRYSHYLYYYFGKDKKFWLLTSFFSPEITQERADEIVNQVLSHPESLSSQGFDGDIVYLAGSYELNGNKVLMSLNGSECAHYDFWERRWYKGLDGPASNFTLTYQFGVGTLTLGHEENYFVHVSPHHTLEGKLTRVQSLKTPEIPDEVEISEEALKGTWDGEVEHDFAQGYYQRWRIAFDGNSYTSWHTHQTAGATGDDVQGLKTVGNKEQGTWEYKDGTLVLTPSKQWASYVITSMSPTKYTYYNYNIETMESDQWYETPDYVLQQGIERDLQDGTDWYISKWLVTDFTNTQLSIMINRDTFKLTKQ